MMKVKKRTAISRIFTVLAFIGLASTLYGQTDKDFALKGTVLTKYKGKEMAVVIPENLGITEIGKSAFAGTKITSVVIPNGVTGIGESAFSGCKSLTGITLSNGVTGIGKNAFKNCTNLAGITIPNGVTSIEAGTFNSCTNLTSVTIGNGVTSIGDSAFSGCKSLAGITMPNGVTSIGKEAFKDCSSLTSVTIGNGVTSIGKEAFKGGKSLTSVTIPNSVKSIGEKAFYECKSLASVTLGTSVTSIGHLAFGDTSLTSVTIPASVTSMENIANGAKSLTAINVNANNTAYSSENGILYNKNKTILIRCPEGKTGVIAIPNGVVKITDRAFSGCSGVTSVTIPNSVNSIEMWAFLGSGLTSITIPNSVNSFGQQAFYQCPKLTSVTFQGPIIAEMYKLGDYGFSPFPGDLKEKFMSFGPGTYVKNGDKWEKQAAAAGWDQSLIDEAMALRKKQVDAERLAPLPAPRNPRDALDGTKWFNGKEDTVISFGSGLMSFDDSGKIGLGTYTISGNTVTIAIGDEKATGTISGNTLTINGDVFTKIPNR